MSDGHNWSAVKPIVIGLAALSLLIGGFGAWAGFATIAGAIIAQGQVEVDQNRQIVQHPDGGVVEEILVTEGAYVSAGETLIRLDPTLVESQLTITENQLFELMARRGRLEAERDSHSEINFDPLLQEMAAKHPVAVELMAGQVRLLNARRETTQNEIEQLEKRRNQIEEQLEGIKAQQASLDEQLTLIVQERDTQRALLDKGLTQMSRLLALRREEARMVGALGELAAQKAQAETRITETDIELLKVGTMRREETITTLRDLQYRELELREKSNALTEQLSRLDIVAPVSGVIYGLQVFAPKSVLSPAAPVLYIVPQDRPLVITAQVATTDIDLVHLGQSVVLRFSALDQRNTPELTGQVMQVSADAFRDETTGASYYRIRILLSDKERNLLPHDTKLIPGMPVEAFFRTGDMTPFGYLMKPFADYFARAFRG